MIECSSTTPNGALHHQSPSGGNDSYFAIPSSIELGDKTPSPAIVDPTPYFTAPRSPLLQHQDFYNAIQNRFNHTTSPFSTDEEKKATPPNYHALQQQQPSTPLTMQHTAPSSPMTLSMGSLAARRRNNINSASGALSPGAFLQQQQSPPSQQPTLPAHVIARVKEFTNDQVDQLLNSQQQQQQQPYSLLLIDIRSFVHYSQLHIQDALNVSIPNTILKRPSFTLDKISDVIVSESQRSLWKEWPKFANIVLYDQSSDTLPSESALGYLFVKFDQAGYNGNIGFLKGGINAFQEMYPSRCASSPVQPRSGNNDHFPSFMTSTTNLQSPSIAYANKQHSSSSSSSSTNNTTTPTTASRRKRPGLHLGSLPAASTGAPGPFTAPTMALSNQAFNPFFSNIRQNMELSHGSIKERFPIRLPAHCKIDPETGRVEDHYQLRDCMGVTAPNVIPTWLREMVSDKDGPRRLAELYEVIERTEQRRLQNLMAHHSRSTNDLSEHPLSIVSGIEMGALNRYTNIWPFEYTRVKLQQCPSGSTGYINASYIEYVDCDPASIASPNDPVDDLVPKLQCLDEQRKKSTSGRQYRRYISTQGPLPATYGDFWTVVWEQETRVIVMLTKEEEMNRIKCHRYWPSNINEPTQYGPIRVTLVSERIHEASSLSDAVPEEKTHIREFKLEKQDGSSRTVQQIHYMGWMDFGVPDDPTGTLAVVKLADEIQTQWEKEGSSCGPMIVHCSAGCGRAGAFCAIDTVIHRLRRQGGSKISEKEQQGHVDIMYQTVAKFREQRVSMVQTLRQFVFCYEAILWYILGYSS